MYFFVPEIAIFAENSSFVLSQTEHFWSLRIEVGQICELTDLCGFYCQVKVLKMDKKTRQIEFETLQKNWICEQDFWQNKNQSKTNSQNNPNWTKNDEVQKTLENKIEKSQIEKPKIKQEIQKLEKLVLRNQTKTRKLKAGILQENISKSKQNENKFERNKERGEVGKIENSKIQEISENFENSKVVQKPDRPTLFQAQIDKIYLEKWVEILPFSCFNQVFVFWSDFGPPQKFNFERLEKILIRSCCQGELLYKPTVEFVDKNKLEKLLVEFQPAILDCEQSKLEKDVQKTVNLKNPKIESLQNRNYLIGPEGGFSQKEKKYFAELGLEFVGLGQIIYPSWLACLAITK